ncbi:MAG: DUF1161 domain-containing protein [Hydrogenophaga sp.]
MPLPAMLLYHSRSLFAVLIFLTACSAQASDSCEDLRARIEANIAGNGVLNFSVTVVDAAAAAGGQVVGSCSLGSKKIVYARNALPTATTKPTARAPAPRPMPVPAAATPATKPGKDNNILTECKDGTVSVGGDCKR